ncbi:MAG: hypothetical protein V1899_00225 [Planctomycetota bacterium]
MTPNSMRLWNCLTIVLLSMTDQWVIAADKVTAYEYLKTIGNTFDVYFSTEESKAALTKEHAGRIFRINGLRSRLFEFKVEPVQINCGLDEHLRRFSEATEMLVSVNPQNSRIYCLRDRGVPAFSILDKELLDFHFDGRLSELFRHEAIKVGIWVNAENAIGHPSGADPITTLQIDAAKTNLRGILSNWLPMSQYERVLWDAFITLDGTLATISFNRRKQRVENVDELTIGRQAFVELVDKRSQMIHKAIDYISMTDTTLPKNQTRWAMLLLGEYRAVEGIQILIKKLEYQYANVPNIREAFPAVAALIEIGEPSIKPLLTAITYEQKSERFVRLALIIISSVSTTNIGSKDVVKEIEKKGNRSVPSSRE